MHRHNIIHRDLKSENIFKHNEKYKIGDFGFAKIIANLNDIGEGTTLGTLATMAPEVMARGKYGIKVIISFIM
jgi:serine/threonine protein kinase